MQVGIFGRGRFGSVIASELTCQTDMQMLWHIDRGENLDGLPVVDLAIDASLPEAVEDHLVWAMRRGTNLVIGTTGWSIPDLEDWVSKQIGVMVAPNFSLTVSLMARFATVLGRYASMDPELDPYIFEHHHSRKTDAPSGTAMRLAESLIKDCPRKTDWVLGSGSPSQLSIAAIRAGQEIGIHTLGLDGSVESMTLTHTAKSRALFAKGALQAARWLDGKKGLYTFDDFASTILDPLFRLGE